MHIREAVAVAVDALRANKVRAVLTSIGVIIGSASIVAVVVAGRTRPVRLIGVTDGYQQIRRLIILRGRYFDFADMEARSKVCLITKDLADRVFGVENPVGRQLRMGELTFTVVGVFRERAETFGLSELQKESVIIPFSLMKYYTGTDVLSTLQL